MSSSEKPNTERGRRAKAVPQKSQMLAVLARGISHDINNCLSAVLMSAEILADRCRPEDKRLLSFLEESSRRGIAAVRQFVWLAEGTEDEPLPYSPKTLVEGAQRLISAALPRSIQVLPEAPPDLWFLAGDPARIVQLLVDLSLQLEGRLQPGSFLSLRARNLLLDEAESFLLSRSRPGKYVVFELLAGPVRQGPPLSLAPSTRKLVSLQGGFWKSENRGDETAVELFLPASPSSVAKPVSPRPRTRAGEVLLVAEPDAALNDAMAVVLQRHGFKTLQASDGPEALALLAFDIKAVAAILASSDLAYIEGPALLLAARKLKPRLPAVGFRSSHPPSSWAAGDPDLELLDKPFSGFELLEAVEKVLHRRRQPSRRAPSQKRSG